ncbi:MAG: dihydrodipicolinate synthase family protein [Candidatus Solibacter usitatus]|nr:dihydrodipicolinate synthase family protein [Candidatus Solibacter usitatus]
MDRRAFLSTTGVAGVAGGTATAAEAPGTGPLTRETYRGLYAYPPTPFAPDLALDEAALRANCRKLVRSGVDGIVLGGTTGEFYTLSEAEQRRIAEILREETRGTGVAGVLGTAGLNTPEVIRRTAVAMEAGLDAALTMQPFYATLTKRELLAFWKQLSAACPRIGLIVYHFDWIRQEYTPEIFRELAALPNVLGSKEGHFDFKGWLTLQKASPLVHMSATDAGWLVELHRLKAPGVGSVNFTLMPHIVRQTLALCGEGKYEEAERAFSPFTEFCVKVRSGTGKPFLFPEELGNWGEYGGTARGKALAEAFGFLQAGPPRLPGIAVPVELRKRLRDYIERRYAHLIPPAGFAESVPPGSKLWPRAGA